MGKIDKGKLLKELKKNFPLVSDRFNRFVESFPEEPEYPIDFDALRKDFELEKECEGAYGKCKNRELDCNVCYTKFLKSKNLTAPKPFEIPAKKTWIIKSEIVDMFTKFKISIEDYVKLELPYEPDNFIKQYYDLHEDPDYRAIPKGSIVEFIYNHQKKLGYIERVYEDGIYVNCVKIQPSDIIRIVELAKE